RVAVGAAGDLGLVHRVRLQAGYRLDADHALVLGLVGEHRGAGDVADRVKAGNVGAPVAVDDDGAALRLDAQLFESEVFDVADDAGGRNHPVGSDFLALAVLALDHRGDRVLALGDLGDLGVGA